jgi:hypothetical protein
MATTKKKKEPLPKRVWVAFKDRFPYGVTKLAEEADEWEDRDKLEVIEYTLTPKKKV